MRTITIEINGDAELRLDGALVVPPDTLVTSTTERSAPSIRHDTAREVVIAMTAHEANRQYAAAIGEPDIKAWDETTGDRKASLIEGVRGIEGGAIKTPADAHESWMASKKDAGWVYGPEMSFTNKTHPNLVPYANLTTQQRTKDRLFFAIASALLTPES